jgi:NAD(P)-dependent dehydrogenase (short-subunit alcohol dehydrogenase family)
LLDARKEEEIISFLGDADKRAALEVCIFNIGANVNFPILDTIERVFRKVWELACCSGFLAGREAAKLVRAARATSFTGATASLRGAIGYAAFASAKYPPPRQWSSCVMCHMTNKIEFKRKSPQSACIVTIL